MRADHPAVLDVTRDQQDHGDDPAWDAAEADVVYAIVGKQFRPSRRLVGAARPS